MGDTMARIRVGVAGWDYRDWHGVIYPKPKPRGFDPVRFLARCIDVIEINSTFYRPARGVILEEVGGTGSGSGELPVYGQAVPAATSWLQRQLPVDRLTRRRDERVIDPREGPAAEEAGTSG